MSKVLHSAAVDSGRRQGKQNLSHLADEQGLRQYFNRLNPPKWRRLMVRTLVDILVSRNELERLYTGAITLHLWRAVRKDTVSAGVLHPELESRVMPRGRIRPADVETYTKDGRQWVRSEVGMGVSLLDRAGAFPGGGWEYFVIPRGTEIPEGLAITKDHYIQKYSATHYSVSPVRDMPVAEFISLLDILAMNAKRRQQEVVNG